MRREYYYYYYYYYLNNVFLKKSVMRGMYSSLTDLLNTLIVQTKGDNFKYIWTQIVKRGEISSVSE